MEHVVFGVDRHKLSATIEVVDDQERLLGSGRFATDRAGSRPTGPATPRGDLR